MMSFRKHTLQEAQTSAAFEMEKVIVAAAGGPAYTPRDKKISPEKQANIEIENYIILFLSRA